jgi:hypothetical protein
MKVIKSGRKGGKGIRNHSLSALKGISTRKSE